MTNSGKWWPVLLVCCIAASCSTDDYPTSSPADSRTIKANPLFGTDIQEILDRRGCNRSPCHGVSKSANLDLRPDSSYANLVGVTSTQSPLQRVAPGAVDSSFIIQKLEGTNTTRMPPGEAPLDAIDLQTIKNWITQGALDN